MDELLDETLGLQNIVLPHVDLARSRAGLYVYLNAAVSSHQLVCPVIGDFRRPRASSAHHVNSPQLIGRPLLDDSVYNYLHNRFEVSVPTRDLEELSASTKLLF